MLKDKVSLTDACLWPDYWRRIRDLYCDRALGQRAVVIDGQPGQWINACREGVRAKLRLIRGLG